MKEETTLELELVLIDLLHPRVIVFLISEKEIFPLEFKLNYSKFSWYLKSLVFLHFCLLTLGSRQLKRQIRRWSCARWLRFQLDPLKTINLKFKNNSFKILNHLKIINLKRTYPSTSSGWFCPLGWSPLSFCRTLNPRDSFPHGAVHRLCDKGVHVKF